MPKISNNTVLDPMTGLPVDGGNPLDVEDTLADPEGVEERQQAKTQSSAPQMLPSYLEADFEFRRGNKDTPVNELLANGKRAYFLQPRVTSVQRTIEDAEAALLAARDLKLTEEERDAINGLAEQVRDLDYSLAGFDEWLGELTKRAIARQVSSDACFIARGSAMLDSWNPTDDNGTERKDSFESVLFSAQKRLAILYGVTTALNSEKHVNLKAAGWQRMQSEARKNQQKYLHAEEYNVLRAQSKDHGTEASRATSSMLLKRKAA